MLNKMSSLGHFQCPTYLGDILTFLEAIHSWKKGAYT